MTQARDHGGNLDAARTRFGGTRAQWLDLSTGINPCPYPVPDIPMASWANLPQRADQTELARAAAAAFDWPHDIIAFAGAQGAIQAMPQLVQRIMATGTPDIRVLAPTYNEHAGAFISAGLHAAEVSNIQDLHGAMVAIIVTPNNPNGRRLTMPEVRELSRHCRLVVVDESFADVEPDHALTPGIGRAGFENVIILRSFGKFYGLAGIRLGFALAHGAVAAHLQGQTGPWPISGPAIEIASAAYRDTLWQAQTIARLSNDSARLDAMAQTHGWELVGGCGLFRTYKVPSAQNVQDHMAEAAKIWTRIFPYSNHWIRFGLPGSEDDWDRLTAALIGL